MRKAMSLLDVKNMVEITKGVEDARKELNIKNIDEDADLFFKEIFHIFYLWKAGKGVLSEDEEYSPYLYAYNRTIDINQPYFSKKELMQWFWRKGESEVEKNFDKLVEKYGIIKEEEEDMWII